MTGRTAAPWGALSVALALVGCDAAEPPAHQRILGGDPERGRAAVASIGCGACHRIPRVAGARGTVGPPLTAFGERALIGGVLPNRPDILVRWVRDAPALAPDTGMPNLPLSEAEARDVAAFLYTLR